MTTSDELIVKAKLLLDTIIIYLNTLNETQRFFIAIGGFSFVVMWFFIRSQRSNYNPNRTTGTHNHAINTNNKSQSSYGNQTARRKAFFTNPGAYDMVEAHPHKFKPMKRTQKNWDDELNEWVKARKKH